MEEKRGNRNAFIGISVSDHQVIMQCRNGGEMSELRRREEIVIYIDCDVVVGHVPFIMLSQSHSTSTQYKLYYNANHFSDEMYTLPGKGINV